MPNSEMQSGDALPAIEKTIAQERIEQYASAAGDFNPIHLDADFARTVELGGAPLQGTIAHGMMLLASVSEMMTAAFGDAWLNGGRLKVRFRAPVYPGETIAAFGEVKSAAESGGVREVACGVGVRKTSGEIAISGDAVARVPIDA